MESHRVSSSLLSWLCDCLKSWLPRARLHALTAPILGKHTDVVGDCPFYILPLDECTQGSREPWQPRRRTLAPLYARRVGDSDHAYGTVWRSDCVERCRAMVKEGMSSRTPRYRAKEINVIKALG